MLSFPAGAVLEEGNLIGGIKCLLVMLIIRHLLDCGLTTLRIGILQAARHGTPQTRRRLVIIVLRAGTPLPEWPKASNVFDSGKSSETIFSVRTALVNS